jgi:cyclic-di-GMP-binding protein
VKNSFFLVIPPQENKPERKSEFEAKALDQWLFELPTANPGLATRMLHDFIKEFNALKMTLEMRLAALEQIRPKFVIIEDYLRSRLIQKAFPKEENDLKILQVLASLEREFTIGYWIVLKELSTKKISWFQGKHLAISLQRCIKGLSSVVISHFIMGMPVPDWVWIDLHSLFKLSVKLEKATIRVPDNTYAINKICSPEECYRQILLLSLSRPTGLMQKEILLTYNFIESLFPYYGLSLEAVEAQRMQFVVVTDEDTAPISMLELHPAQYTSTLYLDLTKLLRALENKQKFFAQNETRFASMHVLKNHEEKPSEELLDYLTQRWTGIELQKELPFSDRLDRLIGIGMTPAHSLQKLESAQNNSISPELSDQETLAHSESEKMLFCIFNNIGVLSVGNLISIRKADEPMHKRALGIVNELIVAKQYNKISFGINYLSNNYKAVEYYTQSPNDTQNVLRALFYSNDEQIGGSSYLIVDNFMLKEGTKVMMRLHDQTYGLLLRERSNIGLGYWQFECHRLASGGNEAKSDNTSSKKGYDFI